MFPIFQAVGNRSSLSNLWKMTLRGDEMTSAFFFRTLGGILSGSGPLLGFSLFSLTNPDVMFTSESGGPQYLVSVMT